MITKALMKFNSFVFKIVGFPILAVGFALHRISHVLLVTGKFIAFEIVQREDVKEHKAIEKYVEEAKKKNGGRLIGMAVMNKETGEIEEATEESLSADPDLTDDEKKKLLQRLALMKTIEKNMEMLTILNTQDEQEERRRNIRNKSEDS